MDLERRLIVNADDFGLSDGVNRGIIEAHEQGIVTSASLMVRKSFASAAAAYRREHRHLSVGLHLDLGEWAYDRDAWVCVYHVVALDDPTAVAAELERQLSDFRDLVGGDPTHLDSHQHAHRHEPVRSAVIALSRRLNVPLREFEPAVRYCGRFFGQTSRGVPVPEAISVDSLIEVLRELPPGLTELGCHPGRNTRDEMPYGVERSIEVDVLSDPRVRAFLSSENIALCSYHDVIRNPVPARGA